MSLLSRVIYGIQPVLLFSMFYNKYIAKRKFRHPVLGGVAMVIYMMALYLISGSRGKVFAVFFQVLFAVTLTLNYGGNIFRDHFRSGEKKGNKFWIKAVVIIAVIGIPLFYYGGVIGGRNYSQISAFQSVENYFSYGLIIMASYDDWVRSVMTLNGIFQIIILMFMENRVYKKYIKS